MQGNVTIKFNVKSKTNLIQFNVKDLIIDVTSVGVRDMVNGTSINVTKQSSNANDQMYMLELEEPLLEELQYQIELSFEGTLNDYMYGFYRSQYVVSGEKRYFYKHVLYITLGNK